MRRPVRVVLALSAVTATAVAAVVVIPTLRSDDRQPDPVADLEGATDGDLLVDRAAGGTVRSLGTESGAPIQLSTTDPEQAADEFASTYGDLLGPGDLVTTSSTPRVDGGLAVRFQQEVDGTPVFGGEASVQVDPGGGVLSTLADLSTTVPDEAPTPPVDAATARTEAVRTVAADTGLAVDRLTTTTPATWWYDPATIGAPAPVGTRLTWMVDVAAPRSFVHRRLLVDALTGTVSLDLDLVGHVADRVVCDFQGIPAANEACLANTATRAEGDAPSGNPEVDRAYDALGAWHDFFADRFEWEGYDGTGNTKDTAAVNVCRTAPCPWPQAVWSSTQAVFGAGYAVDDVVAHEMTHGITQSTAGLVFAYQSGAINESMSDVLGELVDLAGGTDDTAANRWLIGEDLPAGPLRDLADPGAFDDPDRTSSSRYAAGPLDNGGVHTNSGVGNRAASLLADGGSANGYDVRALGPRDTATLWFTVLTGYLTSGSDWADLATALSQACRDLVGTDGITSADCAEVDEAVAATELAEVPSAAPATEAPVCAAGQTPQDLFTDDFDPQDLEPPHTDRWVTETLGGYPWSYPPPSYARYAHSGERNLWGSNLGQPQQAAGGHNFGDSRIALVEAVPVPEGIPAFLRFDHAYDFQRTEATTPDGGVVEVQVVGEQDWVPLTSFVDNGYSGTVANPPATTNPLKGRAAFVGQSRGYLASRADLSAFAGEQIKVRFRLGEDATGGALGWYVDDVRLYTCPPTGPQVTAEQSVDDDRIVAGEVIDLTVTVTNTGTTPLTGITIDTPEIPSCTGPVPDLDPGEHHDVTCQHDTVAPDDVGTFTSTATVDTAEVIGPQPVEPIDVTVLDPAATGLEVTQAFAEDTVPVGDDVHLAVTLRNEGAVTLTGIDLTTPDVAGCDGPAGDLDPGAERTVECTYTTVDPDDIGTFTSTASATSVEVVEPVVAAPAEVTVLAPDREQPTITIVTPTNGMVLDQGAEVPADYSCADDSGFVACTGTSPDGAPIDTSTTGTQVFNVVAEDLDGNVVTSDTRTYVVVNRVPDGRIRLGATGTTAGDGVVNLTGARQNRTARIPHGSSATFFVTAQNDGSHAERLKVRSQAGTANYTIRWFSGGQEITAGVRTGTYQTPLLQPGGVRTLKAVVTVGARAAVGSQVDRLVTITSVNNADRRDVVRFIVKRH